MGARVTPAAAPIDPSSFSPSDLQPGDIVTVEAKPVSASLTVIFNGVLAVLGVIMAFATAFKALNFAATFTSNHDLQDKLNLYILIAIIVVVLICVANTYLRIFKSKQPIATG